LKTTKVFSKNIAAYNTGAKLIVNQGGTSSSKTFSTLQLLYLIAKYSKVRLVISVVSKSLPHLKGGAIRDFENILIGEGIRIDDVKNKTDIIYTIGECIIEFFGGDNVDKAHGPRRDILYLNECNHLSYDIYTQLRIRTKQVTFLDFNPTTEFWVHTEVIPNELHTFIKSTYLDNSYLDESIIEQIESRKNNENWWRVYGLGEVGRLEGAIFDYEFGEFDTGLPFGYGLDFGVKDPDALIKCAVDKKRKRIYWKEEIHQNGLNTDQLARSIFARKVGHKLIIADSQSKRTILDLKGYGLNIRGVKKSPIVDDIKLIKGYDIIVDPESYNLSKELNNWLWLDKKGEVPMDAWNHGIDAGRYIAKTLITPFKKTNSSTRRAS
jgi:phage terminase large subunit